MTVTANKGLALVPSTSPDYDDEFGTIHNAAMASLDVDGGVQVVTATGAGAISPIVGKVVITASGAALLTLAQPVAGLPSAGGNDGQQLTIFSTAAHAHTVTTASNGINGAKHVATFAAAQDVIVLTAYNGVWYTVGANTTTLS